MCLRAYHQKCVIKQQLKETRNRRKLEVSYASFRLQELTAFVESARQRKIEERNKEIDEFDGLSPEEINALAEQLKTRR
jgi:hypothetical protein